MNELLPIDGLKDQILDELKVHQHLIIKASPGSGKTTRVPLFLLPLTKKKIYVLEPRKLAAKLAAVQVAKNLGETVGKTVGYIFRFERVVSAETQIIFVTEGTFLKILSEQKNIDDIGFVILDEFHERHLATDAALSFLDHFLSQKKALFKMLIMSATIETENLKSFLEKNGSTTTLELQASRFDLKISYLPNTTSIIQAPLEKKVLNAVLDIIEKKIDGDLLVFLPGMREMRECEQVLSSLGEKYHLDISLLHGELEAEDQLRALSPSSKRKIILSTNIAESSVTIPGISIVIDSGLAREASFDFFSGLPEIKLIKISKASAIQRAGRSNREQHGLCLRLYAELDFQSRPAFHRPEIERSDLSELTLSCLDLFHTPLEKLHWLSPPPLNAIKNSLNLLYSLNAIDDKFQLTDTGEMMKRSSLHPRFARILVEAKKGSSSHYKILLNTLADLLGEKNKERFIKLNLLDSIPFLNYKDQSLEELLLKGFPDRICKSRGDKFRDLISMSGELIKIANSISREFHADHPLWIVMDLDNTGAAIRISPVEEEWLYDLTPMPIEEEVAIQFDDQKEMMIKSERLVLGSIILSDSKKPLTIEHPEASRQLKILKKEYLTGEEGNVLIQRLYTMNAIHLKLETHHLLEQFLASEESASFSFNNEDRENLIQNYLYFLKENFDPQNQFDLEQDFPLTISLSDKRKISIIYDATQSPWIESFIQDFYGLSQTPRLAKGKLALTLKLLGPHKRSLQVTQDLASFWNGAYKEMYKELTREYPRHHWPTNPESALPILLKRQLPS